MWTNNRNNEDHSDQRVTNTKSRVDTGLENRQECRKHIIGRGESHTCQRGPVYVSAPMDMYPY